MSSLPLHRARIRPRINAISKRGIRNSWPNAIMLAVTLAMYALSTLDWAIDVRLLWDDLHMLRLVGLPDAPHFRVGQGSPPLLVLQGITSVVCVSDSHSSAFRWLRIGGGAAGANRETGANCARSIDHLGRRCRMLARLRCLGEQQTRPRYRALLGHWVAR